MANCVLVQTRTQATQLDPLNRSAISTVGNVNNGTPLSLTFPTTAGSNVFGTETPASPFANVWLAYSPEVNKLVVGQIWGGNDPRNFTNLQNVPFDVFQPKAGDIIQVTTPFFQTGQDPASVAGSTVVELTANGFVAKTASTSGYAGIAFNIGRKESMTIASSTGYGEQVDAWYLECTSNPEA